MQGIISNESQWRSFIKECREKGDVEDVISTASYRIADAMMKQRELTPSKE